MKKKQTSENIRLFPRVFYARYSVNGLSVDEIDQLWASGWFRNDRNVMFTLGKFVGNSWKPVVMLRVRIEGFKWKKRLRRLLRQNSERFEIKIRPFVNRPEVESLWQKFKSEVHGWRSVPSVSSHVFAGMAPASFHTWEVGVYHGDGLVAFSLFDRGRQSIASLEAAYDPAFRKHSLGIFTMLLEIDWCLEQGLLYYYPGFYPKGSSMFDYKLRPGQVEFFRWAASEWQPWEAMDDSDWVLDGVYNKLEEAQALLEFSGVEAGIRVFNHSYRPGIFPSPLVSEYNFITTGRPSGLSLAVAWDPLKNQFQLFRENGRVSDSEGHGQQIIMNWAGGFEDLFQLAKVL